MSNTLFPQPTNYPPLTAVMFERPPSALVSIEPIKAYNSLPQDNCTGLTSLRPVIVPTNITSQPQPFYGSLAIKKEMDDLARKQEEFILRCQYPKRILPGELVCDLKKPYYAERRRERSGSPVDSRRKSVRHDAYRSYSKSPSRLWKSQRRIERSESRSPRRHPEYSPPGARSPAVQAESNPSHRNKQRETL